MGIGTLIKEAAVETPDPAKAQKNLERLLCESPVFIEEHEQQIDLIAKLFSYSQFLADYSIENPSELSYALKNLDKSFKKEDIISVARNLSKITVENSSNLFRQDSMKVLRRLRKNYLLRITLRDITDMTGIEECMSELSTLSEAIIHAALDIAYILMTRKFGYMQDNAFAVIGLGKLGAGELNYSSDIDIISVYLYEKSISSGILTPYGIRTNKISAHEYYCRLTEILANLLQSPEEDGIAYRVDLRLRPNGQKGPVSLSLNSYISYYEAWGKTWERMALIRSRPVAGDKKPGDMFISAIEPFVWKRSIDYNDIDEIRSLKKKIDAISDVNDIKRGYGGIREIEFFVQTFQLLYGGERKNLRKCKLNFALQELLKEGFLSGEDVKTLAESYIFLRRIEHILQMKDDVQTHSLPHHIDEIEILSKKMHFGNEKKFASDLKLKRLMVREMYNSLLGAADITQEAMLTLKDELPEDAIMDYLSFKGFRDPVSAFKNINRIHEQMSYGKTLRERTLFRKTIPMFLEQIMKSVRKDRSLSMLVNFMEKIGNYESYLSLLSQRQDTREIIVSIFSESSYLTKLLSNIENLEGIFEYPDIRMDYKSLEKRLASKLKNTANPISAAREFKNIEELKSGLLFLKGISDVYSFMHALTLLANAITRAIVKFLHPGPGFAVIGLGGFGGEELNISSDLDIIFISAEEGRCRNRKNSHRERDTAEKLIKFLSEYTEKGFVYKVDMRLRPDGSKGVLVNDVNGYKNYYLKSARTWEIQTLIRARPVAGDKNLLKAFLQLKEKVVIQRGKEIGSSDIKGLRDRVIHEVSKESTGYDLKHGPGGIKDIEFLVQYLQLKHVRELPVLIENNTIDAIKRLTRYGILDRNTEKQLLHSHRFLRTVDTLLRLNEEEVLRTDSEFIDIICQFCYLKSKSNLINRIEDTRNMVGEITNGFYK